MKPTRKPRGFTLTELLVVILLIAVIACLPFAIDSIIRNPAGKTTVIRELAEVQLANLVYAKDHNGQFGTVLAFDDKGSSSAAWLQHREFMDDLSRSHFRGKDGSDLSHIRVNAFGVFGDAGS